MIQLRFDGSWTDFRRAVRAALAQGYAPDAVTFAPQDGPQASLFAAAPAQGPLVPTAGSELALPRDFVRAARWVHAHADPERHDLLYRMIWRLVRGEKALMAMHSDVDVRGFVRMERAVKREVHKCHAFVRFRRVPADANDDDPNVAWVAWFEPDHDVLALAAPHFQERFGAMRWSILTPQRSVCCEAGRLRFGPGARRSEAPSDDALEALWRSYYASIFNPARLNLAATRNEMPRRYWQNLPEARLIAPLQREAGARAQAFLEAQPPRAAAQPSYPNFAALRADLARCSVCPWSQCAGAAVAGEGPPGAQLALVGEQPGDQEDLVGRPFVGPAGQLLDQALADAAIRRDTLYATNAVKHFKFVPRGKRRLHQKPNATDVGACRGWLAAELALLRPRVLVCLGTTAALAVRAQLTKLADVAGTVLRTPMCAQTLVTVHPSAVLRAPPNERRATYRKLVTDLVAARALLEQQEA